MLWIHIFNLNCNFTYIIVRMLYQGDCRGYCDFLFTLQLFGAIFNLINLIQQLRLSVKCYPCCISQESLSLSSFNGSDFCKRTWDTNSPRPWRHITMSVLNNINVKLHMLAKYVDIGQGNTKRHLPGPNWAIRQGVDSDPMLWYVARQRAKALYYHSTRCAVIAQ